MSSFDVNNKENFNKFSVNSLNIHLNGNDEEPMDIDTSVCISSMDKTMMTPAKMSLSNGTSATSSGAHLYGSSSSPDASSCTSATSSLRTSTELSAGELASQLASSNDPFSPKNLHSVTNANAATPSADEFLLNSPNLQPNQNTGDNNLVNDDTIIFDSIFANESDFQSFLDVLEKKEVDRNAHKYSEFARKSLYLQFDPYAQRLSSKLSPDKMKRLSQIRDKQEAIKNYLNEIEEETSANNSLVSARDEDPAKENPPSSPLRPSEENLTNEDEHEKSLSHNLTNTTNAAANESNASEQIIDINNCKLDLSAGEAITGSTSFIIESGNLGSHQPPSRNSFGSTKSRESENLKAALRSQKSLCEIYNSPSLPPTASAIAAAAAAKSFNDSSIGDLHVQDLIEEIRLLKENEKTQTEVIKYLQDENAKFKTIAVEFEKILQNLINDKEDTEASLKNEILELTKERNHLQEDVVGVERAFNDLHRRFENLKAKVEEFKKNEEQLKSTSDVLKQQIEKEKQKYSTLKKHAEEKLELANNEIEKLRRNTTAELQTLKAELRRSEIKISSLELNVQQKEQENSQLTNLVEEILSKPR